MVEPTQTDFTERVKSVALSPAFGPALFVLISWIARGIHSLMFTVLVVFFWMANLSWLGLLGVVATGLLLMYQHSIVKADDLSRLDAAFFTTNAFVSILLFIAIAGDVFLLK